MKVMYRFWCKNCNEVFSEEKEEDVNISKDMIVMSITGAGVGFRLHDCKDGYTGIADLVAFKTKE